MDAFPSRIRGQCTGIEAPKNKKEDTRRNVTSRMRKEKEIRTPGEKREETGILFPMIGGYKRKYEIQRDIWKYNNLTYPSEDIISRV